MSRRRGGQELAGTRGPRRDVATNFRRLAAQLGLSPHLQSLADEADERDDGDEDDGAFDDQFADDDRPADSPLTPLRSDYSASESLSSDLSLPRSFGNYDVMRARKPPFDDELQCRTQFNTERNTGAVASDMMRKFYEAQVDKIRAQVAALTQAQHHVETTLQGERQQWIEKQQQLERTLIDERAESQRENERLQSEIHQLRQRLRMEKTHLSDIQISAALAEQLSRQDEDDLSVKEFVQLQVHRRLRHMENELQDARQEIESLQQTCAQLKSLVASSADEVAELARATNERDFRLQRELDLSEASRTELETQLASLHAEVSIYKEAEAKREAGNNRKPTVDVYSENEKLKSELQLASDRLRVNSEKSEGLRTQVDELQQRVVLLTADKAFLQDAKRQLEEHEVRLMASNKELQRRLDLAATTQSTSTRELQQVQEDTRLAFEKQLATEIDKFMEMSKREIATIRANSQMVYERENRLLKEARDDALKQIDMLQTKLLSVQSSLEEKVLEMTRLESQHTSTLSTLKGDLKMKIFEMNQVGLAFEERSSELRNARLEIEMLQRKVEVHKEEFSRLESTSTVQIAQLESSLEAERRKVDEYERLELDLDAAVLQTGAVTLAHGNPDTESSGPCELDGVLATFGAIPTSTKRRFYQSVQLAQRLVKSQREAIDQQRQLDACIAENRELNSEIADLKRQLANMHQPQSYLIDKLGRKDTEIQKLQLLNDQLTSQLTSLRNEFQCVNSAKMALQAQLQQVLAGRAELDTLKRTVQSLRSKLVAADEGPSKPEPSPVMLKNPPSPHVLAQMLRPPTPQTSDDQTRPEATPPKWYIKLRS